MDYGSRFLRPTFISVATTKLNDRIIRRRDFEEKELWACEKGTIKKMALKTAYRRNRAHHVIDSIIVIWDSGMQQQIIDIEEYLVLMEVTTKPKTDNNPNAAFRREAKYGGKDVKGRY